MKMLELSLPIMLFDEHKLRPSFGYVFDKQLVAPYESIVAILWKLGRQNGMSGHLIAAQIAKEKVDPYEGIAACETQVNVFELKQMLKLPLKTVRDSLLSPAAQHLSSPYLRYCRRCLRLGYHSVVHQLKRVGCCPIHETALEEACGHCDVQIPYRLNAGLLDAAYRCSHCRQPYAAYLPSIWKISPLSPQARTLITRARFR